MADPVPGDPKIDEQIEAWHDQTREVWLKPGHISKNLAQRPLREIIFTLDIIRAHCAKALDWRNEQALGGVKGNQLEQIRKGEAKIQKLQERVEALEGQDDASP